jgi:hypothetical protein
MYIDRISASASAIVIALGGSISSSRFRSHDIDASFGLAFRIVADARVRQYLQSVVRFPSVCRTS